MQHFFKIVSIVNPLRRVSIIEQTAEHLRDALLKGRWSVQIPGVVRLCEELGVAKATMRGALRIIEAEGLVALKTKDGRSCRIITHTAKKKRNLRIGFLLWETLAEENATCQQIITETRHELESSGFFPFLSTVTQCSLRHDLRRIVRYITDTNADAWIVFGGTRAVLEWFSQQPLPCFAFAGRRSGLPIPAAAPDKVPAYIAATRCLVEHGHRRIVLLCSKMRRFPEPGRIERAYLTELESCGIKPSEYNMPDWEETPEGYHRILTELFRLTPPTAIIIDEIRHYLAALQFFAHHKIAIPDQVSLICTDYDPSFAWCRPSISHIHWDYMPIVHRMVRWAKATSIGRKDQKQNQYPAEFVMGETIARAQNK